MPISDSTPLTLEMLLVKDNDPATVYQVIDRSWNKHNSFYNYGIVEAYWTLDGYKPCLVKTAEYGWTTASLRADCSIY